MIALCVLGLCVVLCFVALLLYAISRINYIVDQHYIRIRIGPVPVRKVAIADIFDVQVGYTNVTENWTNTIHMPTIRKRAVTIHRKSGWFLRMILTPDDPAAFVEMIKQHPFFESAPNS